MRARWLWLVLALWLSGCGDPITKLVNAKFPPISIDEQRKTALDTSANALERISAPNIALRVRLADVQTALLSDALRKEGVSELNLSGEDQLVRVFVKFSRTFNETDAGNNVEVRKIIAAIHPQIAGSLEVYASMTGALATDATPVPQLELRLLPGLSRVVVDNIKLAENVDATKVGELLASVLNKYRDNITGELTRDPFTRVNIPAAAPVPFDVSKDFKMQSPGTTANVSLQANPVVVPVKLDGVAWLITNNEVTALAQLSPIASEPAAAVKVEPTFNAINHQIEHFVTDNFGLKDTKSTWVAVRKELVANSLNSVVAQAGACVTASGASQQKSESRIPMPSGEGMSCNSDRNCESTRQCSFSAKQDNRHCGEVCALWIPGVCAPRICVPGSIFGPGGCTGGGCTDGHCAQTVHDGACEAQKTAQQTLYNLEANGAKADCDRLRGQETVACQTEEAAKKGLCETGKAALDMLHQTGNLANVDVETNVHTDSMRVCLRDFALSPALDRVSFGLDVSGQANLDLDVKFVPLDLGHLVCQFPWTEKQTFTVELVEKRLGLGSAITLVTEQDKARLDFSVDETTVHAKLSPSPIEFLLKSPSMTVACQGLNLFKPIIVTLAPFVKELKGEFEQKVPGQKASANIPLPTPIVGGAMLTVTASQTSQALVLTGTVVSTPGMAGLK